MVSVSLLGCTSEPLVGEAGSGDDSSAGTEEESDPDECLPASEDAGSLGTVQFELRNLSGAMAYVIAVAPDAGRPDDLLHYRLTDPNGEEIDRIPSHCEPRCGADGVDCGTQCVGGENVTIVVAAGEVLSAEWSGRVDASYDIPSACEDVDVCGLSFCKQTVAAEPGTYEVAFAITPTEADDAPELVTSFVYEGPTTVMIDYEGP